ncbi:MAG: FkbM family methyltransferase [Pseudomonadota bacterium]
MGGVDPPFGTYAPTRRQECVRRAARRLPYTYVGRKLASALLGPAGGRMRRPFDVRVFGSINARLHPYDNICEKRVYLTPDHWDRAERDELARAIETHAGDQFVFVDLGANVGLYSLFAFSAAQRSNKSLKAVCVEADPEMRDRLQTNVSLNGLNDAAEVFRVAVGARDGVTNFAVNLDSRGQSRIAAEGEEQVPVRPLLALIEEAKLSRIDALKIDIEGQEASVLEAFFRDAPHSLRPGIIIAETSHDSTLKRLAASEGYRARYGNALNAVFEDARRA